MGCGCRTRRTNLTVLYMVVEGEDVCYMAVRWGQLASVSESETCEVIGQRGTCICCEVCDWVWAVTSGPRLASRLRMFLSDICSRTATGGILAMVAGRRVTSAFMSLSSSSSCLRTDTTRKWAMSTTVITWMKDCFSFSVCFVSDETQGFKVATF